MASFGGIAFAASPMTDADWRYLFQAMGWDANAGTYDHDRGVQDDWYSDGAKLYLHQLINDPGFNDKDKSQNVKACVSNIRMNTIFPMAPAADANPVEKNCQPKPDAKPPP